MEDPGLEQLSEIAENIGVIRGKDHERLAGYIAGIVGAISTITRTNAHLVRAMTSGGAEEAVLMPLQELVTSILDLEDNCLQGLSQICLILSKYYPGWDDFEGDEL